jgi:quinoprotein glucose dehydrogenase
MHKKRLIWSCVAAASIGFGLSPFKASGELKKEPILEVDFSKTPAFKEAEEVAKGFKVPKGLKISCFAAEPQLVSPVSITTDSKGRLYVIETFRAWGNGGLDMRKFPDAWYDDDLAARTVEDRVAWVTKRAGADANNLTLDSDRIRILEDVDGDGKADTAGIFSDGYNAVADGIAAGILARKGEIYFADIPSLYVLKDNKGDGHADEKKVLATGFGVHYQLIGHDLHGLRMGPDGRLYFSIGDRGCHVITKEGKVLDNPDSGAVFRCDPDGSNMEFVATGLRNPQELAFDQYGNLFTADNNCDYGDAARWVYVVEGGETGWRVGYQFITSPNGAGTWMAENLWHIEAEHPAAYCLPPVAYAGPGPSGIAYYPGTGLGDQYNNHFFMCDFRGGASNSGVWSVMFKPRGATFEAAEKKQFVWNLLPTDLEFANDGGMYIADWVNGWFRPMKGRIWKVTSPELAKSALVEETKKLIQEGMEKRGSDELIKLLGHADQRVRLEAQYELAGRADTTAALQKRLAEDNEQLARIHALWALGQKARKDAKVMEPVVKLLDDADSEIRAQAAKVLGDAHYAAAYDGFVRRLKDETSRVRFFAAMGIAKVGKPEGAFKILDMLRQNGDRDVYLRHAGVMALLWLNNTGAIEAAANDESSSLRLAALLVMRRNRDVGIARFLNDPERLLVEEAARAINDVPLEGAMPQLAGILARKNLTRPLWLRSINANLRGGGAEQAGAVARFAADESNPDDARAEALWALTNWSQPSPRDRVMGLWRPLPKRDPAIVTEAVKSVAGKLASTGPAKVRTGAIELIEKLGIDQGVLPAIVTDKESPSEVRVAALKAMETLKHKGLNDAVKIAFESGAGTPLRREAIGVYMRMPDAADRVGTLFRGAPVADQKAILESLATARKGVGDSILEGVMDSLLDASLPPALQLDLLEAAEKSKSKTVAEKLKQFESKRDAKDMLAGYSECLEGGDFEKGKKVFFEKGSVACIRCHKIGTENVVVGPDLSGIGQKKDRKYLLESILKPNAQIAPGFESVLLKLKGNVTVGGILKKETDKELILVDPNEGEQEIDKDDIVSRSKGLSAMPEGFDKMLTKREVRDLVEFLADLKEGAKIEPAGGHQ